MNNLLFLISFCYDVHILTDFLKYLTYAARRLSTLWRENIQSSVLEFLTRTQGRTQGGGVKTPPELDILQKLYYLRKEIKCFRIIFAC